MGFNLRKHGWLICAALTWLGSDVKYPLCGPFEPPQMETVEIFKWNMADAQGLFMTCKSLLKPFGVQEI